MEVGIREVLGKIKPVYQKDGLDIELVEVSGDVVKVKLREISGNIGVCTPISILALQVERDLKRHIPQVTRVEAVR